MTLRTASLGAAITTIASTVMDVVALVSGIALYQREPALFLPWAVQIGTHGALAAFFVAFYARKPLP